MTAEAMPMMATNALTSARVGDMSYLPLFPNGCYTLIIRMWQGLSFLNTLPASTILLSSVASRLWQNTHGDTQRISVGIIRMNL